MLKKLEFGGHEFEYDPKQAMSYRNVKRIARAKDDIAGFFAAFEQVFAGKDEEYAELLGDDFEKMGMLITEAMNAESGAAKN